MIPFNKPFLTGNELRFIGEAVQSGKISGDGIFTKKCHEFFEDKWSFNKVLLTTSCTHALEMAAILIDVQPGDEVIIPSYTFVSTANAFVLRGAKIIFIDSGRDNPNIDAALIEPLINPRTKAIVPVHYAGIACDMDAIMQLANKYKLWVIEDAAQAIDSFYKGRPLGSFGHLSAFSFHETKNIIAGEGGLLAINDLSFAERAEIIREKGTNRSKFFRGEIDKYGWVDIGSSYLPSEVIAAFLYAQLENLEQIQRKRRSLWETYHVNLLNLAASFTFQIPSLPEFATNNAHMYYLVCQNLEERNELIGFLRRHEVHAVFHYQSLHKSMYFAPKHSGADLPECDRYTDCLVRLPLYYDLKESEVTHICKLINQFYYDHATPHKHLKSIQRDK